MSSVISKSAFLKIATEISPEARGILSIWSGPNVVTESVARAVVLHAAMIGVTHLKAALDVIRRVECGIGFAATGDRAADLASFVATVLP